jgi:hypothetical protein
MSKKRVGIIGAGIGGLTVAALLTKKGYHVTVFEKEEYLGGRALSFLGKTLSLKSYQELLGRFKISIAFSEPSLKTIFKNRLLDDYKLDLGYHAIGGGVLSNVNSVLSELDDQIDFLESYVGMIHDQGYDYPFVSRLDKVKIFPKILRMLFASEKTLRMLDEVSMSETISRYGKGKMKLILEVFSRSITTMNNLDKISTGETFRAQRNLYKGSKPVGYPKKGLSSIHEKLYDYIVKNGGVIKLNNMVDKIIVKNNVVRGLVVKNKIYEFDIVISNILVQKLFEITDENDFPIGYINKLRLLKGTGSLCAYYSLKSVESKLIGKTFHFIERNVGVEGNDAVGMIDFMASHPEAAISPQSQYLIQSYIICTPEEAGNKEILQKMRDILDKNLEMLLPQYTKELNWAIYPSVLHLDGVAKTIESEKPSIKTPVKNLFLVGDCVKAPGIGFNCALNSARILSDFIQKSY